MTDLPPLRDVIRHYELSARKSLGQNFLLDLNLTDRIARAAGDLAEGTVVEIGPGPGGLTRALLKNGAKSVIAVERDPRAADAIRDLATHFPGRLSVIEADALKLSLHDIATPPFKVVANLPYNIATPLMIKWLRNLEGIQGLTLMFQREVADRLAASPRTKAYGRLSVITQWLCEVRPVFNLPKDAFTPPPKVMSTVVNLTPHSEPLAEADFGNMEKITQAAFGQRRKMLRASLKTIGLDPAAAGIDPTRRAEELSIEEFCALARLL
ncbi:MAG: 16S rRNA (adenine(1518)-N(6)/adenine(1519)-N(6))-dimethyltransferase RsmA [Rhodospirillaceae bacterium]|nr:16S rRNA (adenine(1518)-N(6)/adenine(1519)-N(6))-dimethyltransferase RsmA [Rhodospirillaceae bacterium]